MTQIRLAALWTLVQLVSACMLMPMPTECSVAPANEGWVMLSEPPPSLAERVPSQRGHVILWFENKGQNRIKACEKPRWNGECFETGTNFELQDGEWVEQQIGEIVVCTG